MIRVIIADDHAVVRTGLQLIFESTSDIHLEDECATGEDLLEMLAQKTYDVVILDLSMPGKDSIDVLLEIKSKYPTLPVIIFTMNAEQAHSLRLLKFGASAFINKEQSPEILIDAIHKVIQRKKYLTPFQSQLIAQSYIEDTVKPHDHENLTKRELQVMCMIANGLSKSEIAGKLQISINTLSNHRNNVLKKMNLQNNADITRYVIQNGLYY